MCTESSDQTGDGGVGSIVPVLLRCTSRLLATLGAKTKPALASADPSGDDWYANLFWLDGRKCLLVTHAGTLFSIFTPDVRAVELRPIGHFVIPAVKDALRSEGLSVDTFGHLDADEVTIAKTANRSVLGCMNDLAFHCEMAVSQSGGIGRLDVAGVNRRLHRTILGPLGRDLPIELAVAAQWPRAGGSGAG